MPPRVPPSTSGRSAQDGQVLLVLDAVEEVEGVFFPGSESNDLHTMSRGFVKEDDQEEVPFIPPRAPLPEGMTNHVTPRGMRLLLEERARLEQERANTEGGDDERRREKAAIDGRLALLNERILTARPVEPASDPPDDVRFGATVTVRYLSGP